MARAAGRPVKLSPVQAEALAGYAGGDGHETFWGRCAAFLENHGGLSQAQFAVLLQQMEDDGLLDNAQGSDPTITPDDRGGTSYADYLG